MRHYAAKSISKISKKKVKNSFSGVMNTGAPPCGIERMKSGIAGSPLHGLWWCRSWKGPPDDGKESC